MNGLERAHVGLGRLPRTESPPQARYSWTLFKPDAEAPDVLAVRLRERKLPLAVGFRAPLEDASAAFAHVTMGKSGRAVLFALKRSVPGRRSAASVAGDRLDPARTSSTRGRTSRVSGDGRKK